MKKSKLLFYFLSFLEGASVMSAELLGAKMLCPFFGTSLYVWSSVLAITLGGLAMGYFVGGLVSAKKNTERNLYYILLASALFLILMPLLAREAMLHTVRFNLVPSILVSVLFFLFPPVFFMGMVSPMIVQCLAIVAFNRVSKKTIFLETSDKKQIENPGKVAGEVYAISTLGGIISTFLLGFYIIPEFGLTMPAIFIGIFLGIIPFVRLIRLKIFVSLVFPFIAFFSLNSLRCEVLNSDVKKLYFSEGLLGQIIVADFPVYEAGLKVNSSERILCVNRSTQTIVISKNGEERFCEYVHLISKIAQDSLFLYSLPTNPKALVLGLGGGSVANELVKNNFQVDAVELDLRMAYVAKKYFDLSEKVNVHIDDARHYLRNQTLEYTMKSKYDLIILDAFIGEVNPHHLFTKQFFAEVKSLLSDSGAFIINGNGYWNGMAGKGMRSVLKTLINSGFNVEVQPTHKEEDYRNLVFISKKSDGEIGEVISPDFFLSDMGDALILTDEKPQLEILNAEANAKWRKSCMKYFLGAYYSGQDMLFFK
jgi:predicted membrane-bound spermidine synthase